MRNILNIIVDILTLLALVIAGIGHMLPWLDPNYPWENPIRVELKEGGLEVKARAPQEERIRQRQVDYMTFQAWHASRSGIALGVLTLLVCLSMAFSWNQVCRRILVLLMFAAALTAIVFETLIFTQYPITPRHAQYAGNLRADGGFVTALVGTCFAAFFSLIRMLWTMPPVRNKTPETPAVLPVTPPSAEPVHKPGFMTQRELNPSTARGQTPRQSG